MRNHNAQVIIPEQASDMRDQSDIRDTSNVLFCFETAWKLTLTVLPFAPCLFHSE